MKTLIIGIGLLILGIQMIFFVREVNVFALETEKLKALSEETAYVAAQMIVKEAISQGIVIFNDRQSLLIVEEILEGHDEVIEVKIWLYDDSGVKRVYVDGVKNVEESFEYGVNFEEEQTHYSSKIVNPTVITSIKTQKNINSTVKVRTSSYEYLWRP